MEDVLCSKCRQKAAFKCERCFEPYCCSQCQVSDWQDHKTKCYKFPNLIPLNMLKVFNNNMHSEKYIGNQRRHNGSASFSLNDTRRLNTPNCNKSKPVKKLLNDDDFNMVSKASLPPPSSPTLIVPSESVVNTNSVIAEKPSTWRVAFPPSEGFFDAVIQYKEEGDDDKRIVWVTDMKYESSLRKLLSEINRSINPNEPCKTEELCEGSLVAAPLDNVLYRAVVLECYPEKQSAVVRLIDYGNELKVPYSQIYSAIPIMSNLNAYAFRICLPEECGSVDIEDILTIRIVGKKQPDNYYNVECKVKTIPLHLPVEVFDKEPALILVKCFQDNRNALFRLSSGGGVDNQAIEDYLNSEKSISLDFEHTPNVGAFVVARTSIGWKRARLLGFYEKEHKYLVYTIDDGFICLSAQIKKVPEIFIMQPMKVFAISTNSPDCMFSEQMLSTAKRLTLQLLPTTSSMINNEPKSQLPCSLFDGERKIVDSVVVSVFTGSLNELGLKLWHESIPGGSKVYISHALTYKEVFISSLQSEEYPSIFLSEYKKSMPFNAEDAIKINDIVMFCNETKQYSRGQIISCENKVFRLLNIDSGSEHCVKIDHLRKPTDLVCSLPVHCYRVTLMYLESIPTPVANNKALEALETCVKTAVEFEVIYGEKSCVDLLFITKEKQSLCKKLLPMVFEPATNTTTSTKLPEKSALNVTPSNIPKTGLAASVAKDETAVSTIAPGETNRIFTIDDLEIIPITCGHKVPLYVLDPSTILNTDGPYITAADYSKKEFLTKLELYLKSVGEYCKSEKAPKTGYAPKKMEICLAVFADDGEWYRALCIDYKANNVFVVMFLDFGNLSKVNSKDIMPMTQDLMFPSNANMVYVEGITNKEQGLAFLKSIQKNPLIYANVKRLDDSDAYTAKIIN